MGVNLSTLASSPTSQVQITVAAATATGNAGHGNGEGVTSTTTFATAKGFTSDPVATSAILITTNGVEVPTTVLVTVPVNTDSPGSAASATSAQVAPSQSSDNGMPTAVKVGIAVGAVGGVLIAALVAFLLWRCCRKPKRDLIPNPTPETTSTVPELGSTEKRYFDGEKQALSDGNGFAGRPVDQVHSPMGPPFGDPRVTERLVPIPQYPNEPARVPSPWNANEARYPHELSPSSPQSGFSTTKTTFSNLAQPDYGSHNTVIAEADSRSFSQPDYGSHNTVIAEADSRGFSQPGYGSHNTAIAEADSSGFSHSSFPLVHEFQNQPPSATELSSSPQPGYAIPYITQSGPYSTGTGP